LKVILIDEQFHEKEVDFKFIPEIGSILEVDKNKARTIKSRYTIVGVSSRDMIPVLHLKWIGRNE